MTETPSAGATPVAGGATPPQSPPAAPAAESSGEPATGNQDGLGDAGKKALDSMKAAKKAAEDRAANAERELEALRVGNQTESEKAIAKARKEGAADVTSKYVSQLRRSGVKAALAAAGVGAELLDLATKDDVFAELKVNDDGEIEGLDGAITALRKTRPSLFGKAGDFGGGTRGATPETPTDMNTLFRRASGH